MSFIILGSASESNRKIRRELQQKGHDAYIIRPKKFGLYVSSSKGHDKLFLSGKRLYAKDVSGIIPRLGGMTRQGLALVHHMNRNMSIYSTASAHSLRIANNKYMSTQKLSEARVKTPTTIHLQTTKHLADYVDMLGGYPIVAKTSYGSRGKGVFLLESHISATTALDLIMDHYEVQLQEFIETSSNATVRKDIRAWVVNGQVVAAMERHSTQTDFRSNFSISKRAVNVDLTNEQRQMAVNAAKAIVLDCAGVDLMVEHSTGETYCIEVNGNASLSGIEKVTGLNVAESIAQMCIAKGKNLSSSSDAAMSLFAEVEREGWQHEEEKEQNLFDDPDTILIPQEAQAHNLMSPATRKAMAIHKARQSN